MSKRHTRIDDLMSSHHLFDDWLAKNPLPPRFLPSEFQPVQVPQPDDTPTITSLLSAAEDEPDEPELRHYRVPRWWFFVYGAALVVLMILAVRFWKELP